MANQDEAGQTSNVRLSGKRLLSVICTAAAVVACSTCLAQETAGIDASPGARVASLPDPWANALPPGVWLREHLPESQDEPKYPGYFNDVDKAAELVRLGAYRQALLKLREAEKSNQLDDAAGRRVGLLRAEALRVLGRYEEARIALNDRSLAVSAAMARVLLEAGDVEAAEVAARAALAAMPNSAEARVMLGEVLEAAGRFDEAADIYAPLAEGEQSFLSRWRASSDSFENADEVVAAGRGLDRWAHLTGAYRKQRSLHQEILGMFVRVYDVMDRGNVMARVAAARFFAEHDDTPKAVEELQAAAMINPQHPDLLVLAGELALETFDFDRMDAVVEVLRGLDADSRRADVLLARGLLLQRQPLRAEAVAKRLLEREEITGGGKRGADVEAMGLMAAALALQVKDEQAAQWLARVDAIQPGNAQARLDVAETLGSMRQYPRAAAMYQQAIERAPWWTKPRNGLGLLYTQSGDEDLARAALDEARAMDPFNLRTTNYIRLLDKLAGFDRIETEHFVVMYDRKADPVIGPLFARRLEELHTEVTGSLRHEPEVKTLVEVFPSHDQFSVRTTGTPWIGTVGASTGRVIAMVSPRPDGWKPTGNEAENYSGGKTMGAYNWSQVLKHEYTHTVTLSATDNRIPHWMTEGMAVYQERAPLQWTWVPLLYDAAVDGDLFTLEEITWAFVRPKRPTDRQLAYAQSFWMCKYIEETWGFDAAIKMMDGYKAGLREDQVLQQVLGVSVTQFDSGFAAWAGKQVSGWGYDPATSRLAMAMRMEAERLTKAGEFAAALDLWLQVAEKRPVDKLPKERLAGLYLRPEINQPAKAAEQLEALHAAETGDNRYARRLVRLYRDMGNMEKAVQFAWQAVYVNPYDDDAMSLLANMLEKAGDTPTAAKVTGWLQQIQR